MSSLAAAMEAAVAETAEGGEAGARVGVYAADESSVGLQQQQQQQQMAGGARVEVVRDDFFGGHVYRADRPAARGAAETGGSQLPDPLDAEAVHSQLAVESLSTAAVSSSRAAVDASASGGRVGGDDDDDDDEFGDAEPTDGSKHAAIAAIAAAREQALRREEAERE